MTRFVIYQGLEQISRKWTAGGISEENYDLDILSSGFATSSGQVLATEKGRLDGVLCWQASFKKLEKEFE